MKTKDQLLSSLRSYEHDLVSFSAVKLLYEGMEKKGMTKLETKVQSFIPQDSGVSISTYAKDAKERRVFYKDVNGRIESIDEQYYEQESCRFLFSLTRSISRLQARTENTKLQVEKLKVQIEHYDADVKDASALHASILSRIASLNKNFSHLITDEERRQVSL